MIHIRDLIDAFRNGLARYIADVERDPNRQQRFQDSVGLWFVDLERAVVQTFLDLETSKSK